MAPDAAKLLALAEAISDGQPLNWAEVESGSTSESDRALVRELKLLAGLADAHRSASDENSLSAPDAVDLTHWGVLEIRERLGAGTFGTVYRAWDPRLAREVALKILHGRHPPDGPVPDVVEEGRLLARVRHPHVITVFGADRVEGRIGLWMELVHGRTLEDLVRQQGPFSAREAASIGTELCAALAAVHRANLVHRDIKAQNVMREEGGRLVLMDFGAGQDLQPAASRSEIAGTPVYMAPELFGGAAATPRSDIYSLGVLLFHIVTGDYPIRARTAGAVQQAHAKSEYRRLVDLRPDLPPAFIQVVECALAADPSARFDSAGSMELALAQAFKPKDKVVSGQRLAAVAGVTALLVAALSFAGWRMWNTAAPPVAPAIRTIGVRPLANLTGDATQVFFSAGLTDVLLADLGSLRALRIVALPEVSQNASPGTQLAAAVSGLDAIFEGSVQRSNQRLRVAARLVKPSNAEVVWGKTYEGHEGEAFILQARIAADVATELHVSVSEGESLRLGTRQSIGPEAQTAYLHGRYLLDTLNRPNLIQARAEFEKVIRLEPTYAPGHAALAITYLALGTMGVLRPDEVKQLASAEASTAFDLDPSLAEASLALADVRFRLDWDWQGAEAAYRRAIDLNPSYIFARGQYARFLAAAGRPEDGLREARAGYQIDPLSTEMHGVVGLMLFYTRRYDEAIAHYRSRADTLPGRLHTALGRSYAGAGRFPDAIRELTTAYHASGRDSGIYAELGRTLAASGDIAGARRILNELSRRRVSAAGYIAPQDLAYIHIALGELDQGIALLNEAAQEHASRLLWLSVDPRVDPIRADPRFHNVLRTVGLSTTHKGAS
jgi:TolB-like protein/tetratricopeptide (TPR) repeat protein